MRNVQRTASRGEETTRDGACEAERSRSKEKTSGAVEVSVATQAAVGSELFLASGGEPGEWFLVEVAQQDLFAQQPGLHASCTGVSETMQVRAET